MPSHKHIVYYPTSPSNITDRFRSSARKTTQQNENIIDRIRILQLNSNSNSNFGTPKIMQMKMLAILIMNMIQYPIIFISDNFDLNHQAARERTNGSANGEKAGM